MRVNEAFGIPAEPRMGVSFRWLLLEPHPPYYCEQIGVFLRCIKPRSEELAGDIAERWAFRAMRRHGRTSYTYGSGLALGFAYFKGDMSTP